ncbi:hypothetical protein FHW77_002916 [Agrobacterium sp. RC10-4-1]|uniref:hypothetical protein n=1 Tax=Agrobacterium sp. RC10-4-1 TaxID=2587039 RepID=UPI0015FC161B|nr:hypothetical protein [Agrobacterium sp. RC10-4-1]MBA8799197.1 hypothetical protein [Agrobacterium sp. RC10-4-1]
MSQWNTINSDKEEFSVDAHEFVERGKGTRFGTPDEAYDVAVELDRENLRIDLHTNFDGTIRTSTVYRF